MFMKRVTAIAAVMLMIFAIAACGKKEEVQEEAKTFIDARDDGSILANFDKTEKGTGGISGITIEEGEYLVIDTALTEGKVHVTVRRTESDINIDPTREEDTPATIDYVFEGSGTTEYMEIKPGDYNFGVTVEEDATGTITASKKPLEEDAAAGNTKAAE